jgi:hypothetical protein
MCGASWRLAAGWPVQWWGSGFSALAGELRLLCAGLCVPLSVLPLRRGCALHLFMHACTDQDMTSVTFFFLDPLWLRRVCVVPRRKWTFLSGPGASGPSCQGKEACTSSIIGVFLCLPLNHLSL